MKYKRISMEDQGNTTIITMISPEKRNVLAVETMNEMIDTLQSIAESDALGVIIAAEVIFSVLLEQNVGKIKS